MSVSKSEKSELIERLNELLKKQSLFQQEINELQLQITQLKIEEKEPYPSAATDKGLSKVTKSGARKPPLNKEVPKPPKVNYSSVQKQPMTLDDLWKKTGIGSEIEQFIGTNLINKIGMIVVIIGVGIGAKYAIDNDLISPLMRIVLGYLVGAVLSFFAIRLKKNYFNFSAVLFSGAMAIHFFISYAAYTYYGLYSHTFTFILMVAFTVLTVLLALYYNRQVIAHFGLAGAYIVPFLLGDPDAGVLVLFTYMVLVNLGILFISTKKRWKPLNYVAFVATWVIFISWFASDKYNDQLALSLVFVSLFSLIFHLVFLSYKLILKEKFRIDDIFFLLINSTIFWIIGLEAISSYLNDTRLEGLFTFINVILHSSMAYLIYRSEKKHRELFYWAIGLVIAFTTLTVGIQFNQHWVAILWSVEAAFLFWLGRTKKIRLFDYLAFSIIWLTFFVVVLNWISISYTFNVDTITKIHTPIISRLFLSELIVIGSLSTIWIITKYYPLPKDKLQNWNEIFNLLFSVVFLLTIYFTFYSEIDLFWNNIQIYTSYEQNHQGVWVKTFENLNNDITNFGFLWLVNYSLFFICILAFINFRWIKNNLLNAFIFVMAGVLVIIFLSGGLQNLGKLRTSYLHPNLPANYYVNIFHLLIRYVAYLFLALLFYSVLRFTLSFFTNKNLKKIFEIVASVTLITICSSELIHWLSLSGSTEVYKYWLSILWGIFSFILIGYGIKNKKKHLRITSIVLFGVTILKLFFYDLTHLETIPKTIVFISIGALLLVVSFLYNKYTSLIFINEHKHS